MFPSDGVIIIVSDQRRFWPVHIHDEYYIIRLVPDIFSLSFRTVLVRNAAYINVI